MSEWTVNDEMTAALMNQKCVYVGSGAPDVAYEGQFWVDISTDPPLMKVYDVTNTAWLTLMPVYYETQADAWADPAQTPITNGTIVIVYNSTQAGTRIYVRSNGAWVNISTALSASDWRESMIDAMIDGQGDTTYSENDSISGYNFFRDLTIDPGVTLTVTGDTGVIVCRNLNNDGTILKSTTGGAGGTCEGSGAGEGGNGGGMLVIIAKTIDNDGTIKADGDAGVNGTTTSQDDKSGGNGGGNVVCLRYSTHTRGAGGEGGGSVGEGGSGTGGGGGGGGTYLGALGGSGGTGTHVTFGSAAGLDAAIMGLAYAQSTYEYSGSGGGGGSEENTKGCAGGGGGGGGCIYISVGDFDNDSGTVQAIGGKGGNGGTENGYDSGGGGGGGGIIYILYETQTAAGTLTVTAGARGTGDYNGNAGVAGTATAVDVM